MEFTHTLSLLENQQDKAALLNMAKEDVETPYLVTETVRMLSDESAFRNFISDNNKVALVHMIRSYFMCCYDSFTDNLQLDKLLKYAKYPVYKVETPNGIRIATIKEVSQGVKGLIEDFAYPAGEDAYKNLSLLYWTFTGNIHFFREAGYDVLYGNDGKPSENLYQLIEKSAVGINNLFKWCANAECIDVALKKIRKYKRNGGFKYATFEKDEIEEKISIKQLIYDIDRKFPRNSNKIEYRRAIALVIKAKKNIKYLTPKEVSFLREVYDTEIQQSSLRGSGDVDEKLKAECERLLKEQYTGKIKSDHFAYKIIETLSKNNYTTCSAKQYTVISDALKIIDKNTVKVEPVIKETEQKAQVIDNIFIDDILSDISDDLGNGLFEED